MATDSSVLSGHHIRLEPLAHHHLDALALASTADPSLYQWSPVPQSKLEATTYVNTALAWRDAGTAVPFAIVNVSDGVVIGSTRFWNIERWAWPPGNARYNRQSPLLAKDARNGAPQALPDACE